MKIFGFDFISPFFPFFWAGAEPYMRCAHLGGRVGYGGTWQSVDQMLGADRGLKDV